MREPVKKIENVLTIMVNNNKRTMSLGYLEIREAGFRGCELQ